MVIPFALVELMTILFHLFIRTDGNKLSRNPRMTKLS